MDCELPLKLFSTLFELPVPLTIPQTSYFSNSSLARHRSVTVTRHSELPTFRMQSRPGKGNCQEGTLSAVKPVKMTRVLL